VACWTTEVAISLKRVKIGENSYHGGPIGTHQHPFERYHPRPPTASPSPRLGVRNPTQNCNQSCKSANEFKCLFDQAKIKFYCCFNAMYYIAKNASSELVCVHLLKTICLPVLLYAVEVIPATKSDISVLNHVIDRAVFRIFRCATVRFSPVGQR